MTTAVTTTVGALAVPLLLAVGWTAPTVEVRSGDLGCSARPDSAAEDIMDWGLTLDGVIVDAYRNDDPERSGFRSVSELVDPSSVKGIQVICWAAVDRMYGVRFRHGILSIWTTDVFEGARDFLREAHRYRLEGGDVADLPLPHDELVLREGESPEAGGFMLELTHPMWQWMCRVASVDIPAHPHAHGPTSERGSSAGNPQCFSLHDHGGTGTHEGRGG